MYKFALFVLLLLPGIAYAHGEEKSGELSFLEPVNSILITIVILAVVIIISLVFRNKLTSIHKKTLFLAVVISVLFSTIYLSASTVYINLISESGGPVHWHADFEFWVCGEKILLMEPHGLDNKVGSATLHHHNEGVELNGTYRMHVEGVLIKLDEANLEHFFEAIDNPITQDSISLLLHDGSQKKWTNGDSCPNTGKPGKLKVLVNEKEIEDFTDYIINPFSNVPPGDFIKIVFE